MTLQTGTAYILRSCDKKSRSYNNFQWPDLGYVEAPDWVPSTECGNGLHGFLWGQGDGYLANYYPANVWNVAKITSWIDLGGKVKFPSAEVVFSGSMRDAASEIVRLGAKGVVIGAVVTVGGHRTAVAGNHGTAVAGNHGTATAGNDGTATAGDSGTATAGNGGTATAGNGGTATAGDNGIISIEYYDSRKRILTGYIGEDGLEPNVAYTVVKGKFVSDRLYR